MCGCSTAVSAAQVHFLVKAAKQVPMAVLLRVTQTKQKVHSLPMPALSPAAPSSLGNLLALSPYPDYPSGCPSKTHGCPMSSTAAQKFLQTRQAPCPSGNALNEMLQ